MKPLLILVMSVWLTSCVTSSQPAGDEQAFKTIKYRGGLVTFSIPTHWKEEYEPEGGGTFYDPAPDSATLRLDTLTFEAPPAKKLESAADYLSSLRQAATSPVEGLPNGRALIRYTESSVERGEQLSITYWIVANVVPPNHVRIANFSYTMLERQRGDMKYQREVELLDREIRSCVFSTELGVTSR